MKIAFVVLVTAVFAVGSAHGEVIGDWEVSTKDSAPYAATANDSDQVFGQFCFLEEGSCYWLVAITIACKEGDKYPVLANSDTGAVHLEMICLDGNPQGGRYRYAFTHFDEVDQLVRDSTRVGFAMPLQEDSFRVLRFNLRGVETALSVMRDAANKRLKSLSRNTRDQRL